MSDDRKNITRLFKSYDRNGDGVLSREEFEAVLKVVRFEGAVDDVLALVDCDKNGVVSYEEFFDWMFEGDEGDVPSLPAELAQLAASKLRDVYKTLELLEELGLGSVDNIGTLKEAVKGKAGLTKELPRASFTSEYMNMCFWAWTRARWMKSADIRKSTCRLAGASAEDEFAYCSQLIEQDKQVASSFDWDANAPKGVARARGALERMLQRRMADPRCCPYGTGHFFSADAPERLGKWFDAMILAGKQVKKLADPDWKPETSGVGQSSLFSYFPNADAPNAYEKPKVKPMKFSEYFVGRHLSDQRENKKPTREPAAISAGGPGATFCQSPHVITLHVGGAGCGLGVATWNRLFQEHKIGKTGRPLELENFGSTTMHFEESNSGRLVPRAVFADTDPEGLSPAAKTGSFAPVDLCEGDGSTQGNYASAYYQQDRLCESIMERLRHHAEKCSSLQGFMITHAVQGGTGGGLAMNLLEKMSVTFGRKVKWNVALTPPMQKDELSMSASICRVMCTQGMLEHADLTTFMDNTALHQLCNSKQGLGITSPTHADYNALASRLLVAGTSPFRIGNFVPASEGTRCLRLQDILTNLAPYPRVHFTIPSLTPPINETMVGVATDNAGTSSFRDLAAGNLSSVERTQGKNLSCAMLCRNIVQKEALDAVARFKSGRDCNFVDWCPTGFLLGSHRDPTCTKAGDVVCLFNNTALSGFFQSWNEPFTSNGNWETPAQFLEAGVEKAAIHQAIEDTLGISKDYEEVGIETCEGEGEEEE